MEQSYAYIRKVQSEKQAMGCSFPTEPSVLDVQRRAAAPNFDGTPTRRPTGKSNPYENKKCNACGELGHNKERCYEVIGNLDWWDFTKKPRKNVSKAVVANAESEQPDATTANVAHSSISHDVISNSTWIIDSGASDHMKNDPKLVKNLRTSPQNVVSTVDGSRSQVKGEGSIALSDSLTLDSVLVVPSLSYSLLFVSQIILELTCTVTFYPSFCLFQDILTRQTLGYGVRKGKMYYLDLTETGEKCKRLGHANQIKGVKNAREIVWLWHR